MVWIIFLCMGLISVNAYGDICFPGENLWRMTKDICEIVDPCCSIVDEMHECLIGTAITQATIDAALLADVPVISQPGNYYLCESITVTDAVAITIAADDVYLDLNGHTITCTGTTGTGILCSDQSNVQILNGVIDAVNDGVVIEAPTKIVTRIFLSDLIIVGRDAGDGIRFNFVEQVFVKNCRFINQDSMTNCVHLINSSRISLHNLESQTSPANNSINGIYAEGACNNIEIVDCSFNGEEDISNYGIAFIGEGISNIIIKNCSLQNFEYGILFESEGTVDYITVDSCIIVDTAVAGIQFVDVESSLVKDCSIVRSDNSVLLDSCSDVSFINCDVTRSRVAFEIRPSSVVILLQNCKVNSNSTGFLIDATDGPNGIVLDYCIATHNTTGFLITGDSNNVALNHCIANFNGTGFSIANDMTSGKIIFDGCIASGNSGAGISSAVTLANTVYYIDTRSSNISATTLNPAYQLNGAPDVFGTSVTVITS